MEPMSDIRDMVIPDGIRETVSEDGAVLLDIDQGICFSLNPVGLKIWELLSATLWRACIMSAACRWNRWMSSRTAWAAWCCAVI